MSAGPDQQPGRKSFAIYRAATVRGRTCRTFSRQNFRILGALALSLAFSPLILRAFAGDGAGDDLQQLRKEVEALKAGQKEMQKTLQIVKDILMGKQPPLEDVFVSTAGAPAMGEKTAKVTIVEFSDYQCPFCGRYATQTMPQLLDEYVKTGKVRYVFRNFPLEQLHPLAEKAAEASACAGDQGKYWEAHDRFFKNQQALDAKEMQGHAAVLGLDASKFKQCLDSGKYASLVKADVAEGQKYNVRGTPSFFFGTEVKDSKLKAVKFLSGAVPFQNFKDVIDNLLNPPVEPGESSGQ
jgi:protein-disulfide isomerase